MTEKNYYGRIARDAAQTSAIMRYTIVRLASLIWLLDITYFFVCLEQYGFVNRHLPIKMPTLYRRYAVSDDRLWYEYSDASIDGKWFLKEAAVSPWYFIILFVILRALHRLQK
ncbi:hypothetical protein [Bifidobacterium bombi]|uniref:hypothetical protein n=1 Tax=Bifidobacterium bombi TaxID=471511 RepID=UPI0013779AD9|nr:hypothetical protein [Bifidobacterium bombi]